MSWVFRLGAAVISGGVGYWLLKLENQPHEYAVIGAIVAAVVAFAILAIVIPGDDW